jgi:IS4 transposase
LRWQIELRFKRLKSLLHLDRLPAKDPALAQAWLHAHRLIARLAEDCIADKEAFPP